MSRLAVLGAGAMGSAVARLLARRSDQILVLDPVEERARRVAETCGGEARRVDGEPAAIARALDGVSAVAACIPYRTNLSAMEGALAAGCSYADLGGMFHMTRRQLMLHDRFRDAGVSAILGIGAAPGMTNLLAKAAADRLDRTDSIEICTGSRSESNGFGIPYSAETILDEFTMPAMVFEDGEMREVPAGSGAVLHRFPEPVGELEAVYTLHSEPATLPQTIPGVRAVRWRLGLPPSVAQGFRLLTSIGLASEQPLDTPDGRVKPRSVLLSVLSRLPAATTSQRDAEYVEARVAGEADGVPREVVARAFFGVPPEGIDAGAFATGLPIAVALCHLAAGAVAPGVHPPETGLPVEPFLDEVSREGVDITFESTSVA